LLECGERLALKREWTLREKAAYQFRLAKHHLGHFADPY
jgi:hypothetical protein